jgi:hypothetical protein
VLQSTGDWTPSSLLIDRGGFRQAGCVRTVDLADLVDEPWIMSPLDALGGPLHAQSLSKGRMEVPSPAIT